MFQKAQGWMTQGEDQHYEIVCRSATLWYMFVMAEETGYSYAIVKQRFHS